MRFTLSLTLVLSCVSLLTSCGFRDGWGEDETPRSDKTAEQYCEDNDGFSWVDGKCQKDSFLLDDGNLNESQCESVKDAYWADNKCSHYSKLAEETCLGFPELIWHGEVCAVRAKVECEEAGKFYDESRCVDRPTVTFTGELTQNISGSGQIEPIAYEVTQGAVLSIADTTCDGFFALKDGEVTSNPDYKLAEGTTTCEATLVALQRTIESVKHKVVVQFSSGFLTYCNDPNVEGDIFYVTNLLRSATKTTTCKEAAEVLAKLPVIEIEGKTRISRLEPFSGLNSLRQLEVRSHSITVVPAGIANLIALRWLDLSNGKIADISALASSKSLQDLFLDGNPIAIPANRTEKNCPTSEGTNEAVKKFCLSNM